jgi:NCAIR mutase (PurE)-related protein
MDEKSLIHLLNQIKAGDASVEEAVSKLRSLPFESLGFANIDHHRTLRCGIPEVIYCPGKTTEQIVEIFQRLADHGHNVLATRTDPATFEAVKAVIPDACFESLARAIVLRQETKKPSSGYIAVVTAGTSDIPVAEEARITAELLGQQIKSFYDVGVAGLHRLLSHTEQLQNANAIVVVAGMEGALASVVGGLVSVPVIAVPTSIGYGASFGGVAALLSMLNSCASGVSVVNIDNGFSAGTIAAMINRQTVEKKPNNHDQ